MILHFLEVWTYLAVAFAIGCLVGASLYGLLADSSIATSQGAVADAVGDVVDRIKSTLGISPVWRRSQLSAVDRQPAVPRPTLSLAPPARVTVYVPEEEPPPALLEEEAEPVLVLQPMPEPPRPPAITRAPEPLREPLPHAEVADRIASAMAVAPDGIVPKRPAGVASPRGGVPDNLTRIRGVGRRNEQLLNSLGIFHFGQIAAWTPAEMRWIGQYLAFPERIERDDWQGQAIVLASGGDTGFEKSSERRRRRRQEKMDEIRRETGDDGAYADEPDDPTWYEEEDPADDGASDEQALGTALQEALEKAAAAGRAASRRSDPDPPAARDLPRRDRAKPKRDV